MSSQLGDSNNPTGNTWFDVTGNKEFWNFVSYNMPAGGGTATGVHIYVAGYQGSINIKVCIWDGSNNLVWSSPNKGCGTNLQWQFQSIPNIFLPQGNYFLGFWSAGHPWWSFENTGGVHYRTGLSGPASNTGSNDEYGGRGYGELGIYVTYNPGSSTGSGGIAVMGSGSSLSYHPLTTLDPDGTFHRRPVMTLDHDGTWHHRG